MLIQLQYNRNSGVNFQTLVVLYYIVYLYHTVTELALPVMS